MENYKTQLLGSLLMIVLSVFLLIAPPAHSQNVGGTIAGGVGGAVAGSEPGKLAEGALRKAQNICHQGVGAVLNQVPGFGEVKELLNFQFELGSLPGVIESEAQMQQLKNQLNKFNPSKIQSALNQLNNLKSLLPGGGNIKVPAILGGAIAKAQESNNKIVKTLRSTYEKQKQRHEAEKAKCDAATDPEAKRTACQKATEAYNHAQELFNFVNQQASIQTQLGKANATLNNELNNSKLGKNVKALNNVLTSFQTGTIIDKAVELAKTIKGLDNLVKLGEDLQNVCGLLPNGTLKQEMETLIAGYLNGHLNAAFNKVKEVIEELINKAKNFTSGKASAAGTKVGGAKGAQIGKVAGQVAGGLTEAVLREVLGKLLNAAPQNLSWLLKPFAGNAIPNYNLPAGFTANQPLGCQNKNAFVHMTSGLVVKSNNFIRPGSVSVCSQ